MVKLKNWYGAERTDNKKYLCAKEKNDITNFFVNSEIGNMISIIRIFTIYFVYI